MAKQEVGLKIDVDVKSVGNMKQELRAATQELIAVNEKFGSTSTQAVAAAKRVASLKDAIGDAKALADTFNPDKKFVALGGAIQGAVAGFSALQGAIGLFGSESKDVEKILLKVQSAMALQQGISGVASAMDAFGLLAGKIKTQVIIAFNSLRAAIGATGIGLLVVGLGLLVANFDKVKEAVMRLIPGLESISKFVGGLVQKFTDLVGITSQAERTQEVLTKTNKKANDTIDAQIKILEAQGGKEAEIYALKKQRAENDLNVLRGALSTKKKLSDDELKQFRDLKTEQQVLDIEESNRKKKLAEDAAKEQKDAADKARQTREQDAKDKKQKDEEEKKRQEELQKNTEENLKNNAKRTKDLENQLRLARITDEKERAKVETQIKLQDELDAETERFKSGEVRLEQYLLNLALIRQRYAAEDKAKQEADKLTEDEKTAADLQKKLDTEKAFNEELVRAEEQLQDAKFEAASAGLNAIATLAQGNEKIANIFFAIDKALAIGKIIVDAQKEIASNMSYGAAHPMNLAVPGSGVALGAKLSLVTKIRAAASIASIAAATIAKFKSGGGGAAAGGAGGAGISTAAPVAPALAPQVEATQVNTAAVNQMGNRAARAYVLNSDIQNEQQRNAYIDRNASIGNP